MMQVQGSRVGLSITHAGRVAEDELMGWWCTNARSSLSLSTADCRQDATRRGRSALQHGGPLLAQERKEKLVMPVLNCCITRWAKVDWSEETGKGKEREKINKRQELPNPCSSQYPSESSNSTWEGPPQTFLVGLPQLMFHCHLAQNDHIHLHLKSTLLLLDVL